MFLGSIFGLSFLSLALPLAVLAEPHARPHLNRHSDLAKRASGDVHIYKRFSGARWSFYDVGLGACGQYNVESDFMVALNTPQYGGGYPGPNCFKTITMSYNGKTTTAKVMDQCPGCPYGGLDLSRGLFRFFAAESVGIIYGEWWFNDGNGDGGNTPTTTWVEPTSTKKTSVLQWTPTTTWTPEPIIAWTPEPTTSSTKKRPTSTWQEPSATSTTVEPTTSSTVASSTSSTVTSSSSAPSSSASSSASAAGLIGSIVDFSGGAASGLAVPTGIIVHSEKDPNNINAVNSLFINLGGIVVGAAKAS